MKNKRISLIKNQIFLATHQTGFWIGTFVLLGYVVITFLYYCVTYFGVDAASTLDASDMYAFNGSAPCWQLFISIVPMLCALNFGYQNSENRKKGTNFYVSLKVTSKEYWKSMAWANLFLTFGQFEVAALLSLLLNRIAFPDTGVFFEGVMGTRAYWMNITETYTYRWPEFRISHPWLYAVVFSLIFSVFCMGMAHFLYAVSLYIKKNGLWIFVIAAGMSFIFHEVYMLGGYDLWGDISVSVTFSQSGGITVALWLVMMILATILIRHKSLRWEHEE